MHYVNAIIVSNKDGLNKCNILKRIYYLKAASEMLLF